MKVYIAGAMTGIPQFNFPAFDAAAAALREAGFEVVTPSEMDDPESRAAALASPDGSPGSGSSRGETWGDFLARDVRLIVDSDIQAIYVIREGDFGSPKSWTSSRGARFETFTGAFMKGLPIYTMDGKLVPARTLIAAVLGLTVKQILGLLTSTKRGR